MKMKIGSCDGCRLHARKFEKNKGAWVCQTCGYRTAKVIDEFGKLKTDG